MMRDVRLGIAALVLASGLAPTLCHADPIVAGPTQFVPVAAIQDIELLPNTPFNPTGSSIFIADLTAFGQFTVQREAQAAVGADIPFVGETSLFVGFHPLFGPFELGSGPPLNIGSYAGTITDVVQDPGDATGDPSSFLSGTWTAEVTFGFRILALGVDLFTVDPVTFTGTITSLTAPPPGTLLTGDTPVTAYFTDPSTGLDIAVGISTNRRLLVTPEPSGLVLSVVGLAGILGWRRRRRSG